MIKILHIVASIGTSGGVQMMLANYYSRMNTQKIRFDFVSLSSELTGFEKVFLDRGSKIFFVPPKRKNLINHIREINRIIKSEKYDIVHVHQDYLGFVSLGLAWLNKTRVRIAHSHKANLPESLFDKIRHRLYATLTSLFSTDVWGCGQEALDWAFKKPNKPSMILNNALDLVKYKFDPSIRKKVREKLNIGDNCVVLGNVARFSRQKNHEFLIDLFEKALKTNPHYRLLLVGTGELFDSIMQKIKDAELEDKVLALGDRNDVHELLQAMDIFVLPSIYEGLPIVKIEAQITNLPCVCSDSITREMNIIDNVIHLPLIDTAVWCEAIKRFENTTVRCDQINAIRAEGYDIELEANKLEDTYSNMLMRDIL